MEEEKKSAGLSVQKMFILGLLVVFVVAIIVLWTLEVKAIRNKSTNPMVVKVASIFDIPAVDVNGSKVAYADYVRDIQTIKKFYESSVPAESRPTEEEMSDQAISRLISNAMIKDLSKNYDIKVEEADIAKIKDQIVANFANEEAMLKDLKDKYGWTFEQYRENVVRPLLMEQKLAEAFSAGTDEANKKYEIQQIRASHILFMVSDPAEDAKVKAEALAVLKRIKAGEDFAKLAGEFGSDGTKEKGGDLGWFGKGQMVPEFETAAFALKDGELSKDLVKTQYGYHIIKKTGEKMARDFNAFMTDQLKAADIKFLVPIHNPFESLQK